jgi:hypothetical protein
MGLSDALKNRLALSRGESLRETIRIFLASKDERKKIAARKFPGRAVPISAVRRPARGQAAGRLVAALLDPEWYAGIHALSPAEATRHFAGPGLAAGLAPSAALAGSDGKHLSPRGAEILHRMGLPLGAVPDEAATSDGIDPWAIGNPGGRPLAVVTAITSATERLLPVPAEWAARADFYVLTAFAFSGPGPWRAVRPVYHHPDPHRMAGFAKTHLSTFFAAYRQVLWLDPDILCCADPVAIAGASGAAFACFRKDDRTPAAEAAAAARDAPEDLSEFIGSAASHPAFDRPGVLDASVLLVDPSDDAVRRLAVCWWRHAMRGAPDGLALTLAAAETPLAVVGDLPGRALDRSPAFARGASA